MKETILAAVIEISTLMPLLTHALGHVKPTLDNVSNDDLRCSHGSTKKYGLYENFQRALLEKVV